MIFSFRDSEKASLLHNQWRDALKPMIIRHPNRVSTVHLTLADGGEPMLKFSLDKAFDTTDLTKMFRAELHISTVCLKFFPGTVLAQAWIQAAWVGYLQHEAMELVTIGNLATRPLDPHNVTMMYDRGLREGLPTNLTPQSMIRAFTVIMPQIIVDQFVKENYGR